MKNSRSTRAILGVALAAATACSGAWSQSVQIVTETAAPSRQVSVTTETTTTSQPVRAGTVVKEVTRHVGYHHEGIADSNGNVVDLIVVKAAPPELKTEVVRVETRPADNAVWMPGYWQWDGSAENYAWVEGTWRRAIPGMTWNTGRWDKVSNGYEWSPGFWSGESGAATTIETTRTLVLKEAPPALKEETRTASPGVGMAWIPGNWSHEKGEYVWTSGRWERPAAENMTWTPARWYHNAAGYGYTTGHWEYPVETRSYVVTTEK
jgi:hypothetical protein